MMERTQIWNCGGGTQSAAIAVLIIQGKLPKPDLAVIADTGRERSTTWEYMDQWMAPALADVGVILHRVSKTKYTKYDIRYPNGVGWTLPFYTNKNGTGDVGKLPNYCSGLWKVDVTRRWATHEHNVKKVTTWIGFSADEIGRAAKAQTSRRKPRAAVSQPDLFDPAHNVEVKPHNPPKNPKWEFRFPLIELGISRDQCIAIVGNHGWPTPPRSSCWMCPNHHMNEWREIRNHPDDWRRVVLFDRHIRTIDPHVWLTAECKPIDECDFDDANEVLFGRDRGGCDSGQCFV